MDKEPHQERFDLYSSYAGRCPPRPTEAELPPKVALCDATETLPNVKQELRSLITDELVRKYRETVVDKDGQEGTGTVLLQKSLASDPSLEIVITKQPNGRGQLEFFLELYKERGGANEQVCEFGLTDFSENDTWDFSHRLVRPQYREQGIASPLLDAGIAFVQRCANQPDVRRGLTLYSTHCQPEVLAIFEKKGFRAPPGNEENARNVERMLQRDSDDSLFCWYAYRPQRDSNGQLVRDADSDKVVYIPDTSAGVCCYSREDVAPPQRPEDWNAPILLDTEAKTWRDAWLALDRSGLPHMRRALDVRVERHIVPEELTSTLVEDLARQNNDTSRTLLER